MPMWRCPHCGTPQAETARCWVCRRSSTACGTCRHFRRSVAANLGYCGLDRRRQPLDGEEIRACWEAGADPLPPAVVTGAPVPEVVAPARGRDFVEIGPAGPRPARLDDAPVHLPAVPGSGRGEPGWSLWGELEP